MTTSQSKSDLDNHANQLNPERVEFYLCRGIGPSEAVAKAQEVRIRNQHIADSKPRDGYIKITK